MKVNIVKDIDSCKEIWLKMVPQNRLFDLWEIRASFHNYFQNPLMFITVEVSDRILGFLPLAYISEKDYWGYFPGEIWNGRTWLEQNQVFATDGDVYQHLLAACPKNTNLRYLNPDVWNDDAFEVDETGYLFHPPTFDYSMENFRQQFSGKHLKKLRKELEPLYQQGLEIQRENTDHIDIMFQLNQQAFGDYSYFSDPRFYGGFRDMLYWLLEQGYLHITTVLIGGTIAAVDVSAVYQQNCTVLAGGTNPQYLGVAKVINQEHLNWACVEKINEVDFLCGDFGWKQKFHLTPRPLFQRIVQN